MILAFDLYMRYYVDYSDGDLGPEAKKPDTDRMMRMLAWQLLDNHSLLCAQGRISCVSHLREVSVSRSIAAIRRIAATTCMLAAHTSAH